MEQVRIADTEPHSARGPIPLLREDRGPVALLTLNRPEARNSLSEELIAALNAAVAEIGASDSIRAVVITGAGSAFSSGHDLKELSSHRSDPDRDQHGRRILGLAPGGRSLLIEAEVLSIHTEPRRPPAPPGYRERPDDPP